MHKIMIALAGAGLLALTGCASTTPAKSAAPQAPAKTEAAAAPKAQLTEEAKQTLAKAEADIKAAQAKKALWGPAQNALKDAKAAAEKNDSAAVIKHAKEASELAQLGIAQTQYPVTTINK
jgi:peptide subunit release factor 1 (eRF1)